MNLFHRGEPGRRVVLVLAALALMALYLRLGRAGASWLHWDDFHHLEIARQATLEKAYHAASRHAHPPVGLLLFHLLYRISSDELFLRFFSALVGALTLIPAYAYWRRRIGPREALAGAVILAFSPLAILVGSEMRTYSFLLALFFSALYLKERDSWIGYLAILHGAALVHYSTMLFAAVVFLVEFPPKRPWRWVLAHVPLGLQFLLQYDHHMGLVRKYFGHMLHVGFYSQWTWDPARESLAGFLADKWGDFAASAFPGGGLLAAAPLVGWYFLPPGRRLRWGLLLLVPLLVGTAVALARLYPLNGLRHSVYLLPFVLTAALPVIGRVLNPATAALGIAACLALSLPQARKHWRRWPVTLAERAAFDRRLPALRAEAKGKTIVVLGGTDYQRVRYFLKPRRVIDCSHPKRRKWNVCQGRPDSRKSGPFALFRYRKGLRPLPEAPLLEMLRPP